MTDPTDPADLGAKIAHLGFIHAAINRLALQSYVAKAWSVTLVSAILVLSARDGGRKFALLAMFPALVFWGLDACFTHQQRVHRTLYEQVAAGETPSDAFTMDTALVAGKVPSVWRVLFSRTLFLYYGFIVVFVLAIAFVHRIHGCWCGCPYMGHH